MFHRFWLSCVVSQHYIQTLLEAQVISEQVQRRPLLEHAAMIKIFESSTQVMQNFQGASINNKKVYGEMETKTQT